MASLRSHPKSDYYIACFRGGDGKRHQRSTRVKRDNRVESRRKAQKIADEYEDIARKKRVAQQVQIVVQELYQEAVGTPLDTMSPKKFVGQWLKDKKGSVEPKTFDTYNRILESWLVFLGAKAEGPLQMITEEDIRNWRDDRRDGVSATTVNIALRVLRMLLGDASKRDLIGNNPAVRVPVLKRDAKNERRPFTVAEIQKLLPHLPAEWKSLVLFGLYTGQRLGDLVRLRWRDIDETAQEIRFVTKKTGRAQKIPIAEPLLRHLDSLPQPMIRDLPLHPDALAVVEAQKGSVSTLSRQFHDFMAIGGLVPKRAHERRAKAKGKGPKERHSSDLTFHGLRHTLTSMLKNAGVSSAIAEEIVGHNSSEMNRIYTHIEQGSLAKAMSALPDITL